MHRLPVYRAAYDDKDRVAAVELHLPALETPGACCLQDPARLRPFSTATLDRIGSQPAPLVRELFRNPVTAHGHEPLETPATGASRA